MKIINQQELPKILPFGETKIKQLIKANVLPLVKVGRDYITTEERLEKWLFENEGKEIKY